jgi:serine/threonine protein kinase
MFKNKVILRRGHFSDVCAAVFTHKEVIDLSMRDDSSPQPPLPPAPVAVAVAAVAAVAAAVSLSSSSSSSSEQIEAISAISGFTLDHIYVLKTSRHHDVTSKHLLNEAETLSQFSHPYIVKSFGLCNIISLYFVFVSDSLCFYLCISKVG